MLSLIFSVVSVSFALLSAASPLQKRDTIEFFTPVYDGTYAPGDIPVSLQLRRNGMMYVLPPIRVELNEMVVKEYTEIESHEIESHDFNFILENLEIGDYTLAVFTQGSYMRHNGTGFNREISEWSTGNLIFHVKDDLPVSIAPVPTTTRSAAEPSSSPSVSTLASSPSSPLTSTEPSTSNGFSRYVPVSWEAPLVSIVVAMFFMVL